MIGTTLPTEEAGIAGVIDPDAYSTGTQTTGWINMADFEAIMAIVAAGTLGASATIDAKLEQATDSSGTSAKDVSGKSITQLSKGSPDGSDKQALINMRREELDVQNGFTHVRLSLTVGTASSDAGAVVLGYMPRHGPASDQDISSVAEIVQ